MLSQGRHRVDKGKLLINRVEAITIYTAFEMNFVFICVLRMHFYISTTLAVKLEKQAVGGCTVHVSDK